MKKSLIMAAAAAFGLCSCEKDSQSMEEQPFREYKVSTYQDVEITGNVVVEYDETAPDDQVEVHGHPELISEFDVRTENNTLYLEAHSEAELSDSVRVIIGEKDVEKIVLNAQQEAVFRWNGPEGEALTKLDVETRGGSKLWFHNLHAENVEVEMKGNSEVYLDSRSDVDLDSVEVPQNEAMVAGDFVVHNNIVYLGDEVQTHTRGGAEVYVIYGDEIERHYIVENMEVRTVGNTRFEATNCAVKDLDIHLTGNSEADVWVFGNLSGEGSGSSILRYREGGGNINIIYNVVGGAVINIL